MAYLYDLTDTWNAAGTVFNAIKMNVTNTASAAGSKIVSLQVGATDRFTVDKDGNGYFSGTLQAVGSISSPNTYISGNSGTIGMQDNSASILAYNGTGSGGITNTLRFITGATERVRINGSGNLGIGTATPAARLHLYDAAAPEARLQIGTNTSQGLFSFYTGSSKEGGVGFYPVSAMMDISSGRSAGWGGTITFTTDTSERMRITSAGNVGIGTSSPTAVWGTTAQIGNGTGNGTFSIVGNGGSGFMAMAGGNFQLVARASTPLQFGTNDAIRATIDTSGNVGIGTSSPGAKLHVVGGNIKVDASTRWIGYWEADGLYDGYLAPYNSSGQTELVNSYGSGGILFKTGTAKAERMRLDASGNLLVGKTDVGSPTISDGLLYYKNASGGGSVLYATNGGTGTAMAVATQADTQAVVFFRSGTNVGNIGVTSSSTSYNTSSDYRLKDIDGPIQNSGAYIDALKPVQGSWKADGSRFIGLIAHEVQEVSETQIATGVKDGDEMQAMDYSAPELIANLIAEIQSLRARVAQLEGN